MRIDCPSCHAGYEVPPERLAAGRMVKCVRCAKTWVPVALQVAAPGVAEPDLIAEPVLDDPIVRIEAAPNEGVQPQPLIPPVEPRRRSRAPLVAAWLLSIAALAALGWAAIDRRAAIMAAWPPSTRAYAAIGLAAR